MKTLWIYIYNSIVISVCIVIIGSIEMIALLLSNHLLKFFLIFVTIVPLFIFLFVRVLVSKNLIQAVCLLKRVIHDEFSPFLRLVHEGERLNHVKEEALIDQELLSFVRIVHLLGVCGDKRVEVSIEFLRVGEGLLLH